MFGTDRCVLRLWSVFGKMFKIRNLRPSPRLYTMSAYSPRALSADRSHTMFCVNSYLACPVSVSWNVCWISAGCICNGRKETAKIAKRLWPRRFSTAQPSRRVPYEGVSGFGNFVWIMKSSFAILLQKIGPRIQRKDKISRSHSSRDRISHNAQVFSQWWFVCQLQLCFVRISWQQNLSRRLSYYGFCICTVHIPYSRTGLPVHNTSKTTC